MNKPLFYLAVTKFIFDAILIVLLAFLSIGSASSGVSGVYGKGEVPADSVCVMKMGAPSNLRLEIFFLQFNYSSIVGILFSMLY